MTEPLGDVLWMLLTFLPLNGDLGLSLGMESFTEVDRSPLSIL